MRTVLYLPSGLYPEKARIHERLARKLGGAVRTVDELLALPEKVVPAVASYMELKEALPRWQAEGRAFLYWDRGYLARGGRTWLPVKGDNYRWHLSRYQMQEITPSTGARFAALGVPVHPWRASGMHIVIAAPSEHYAKFHGVEGWLDETLDRLKGSGRRVVVRPKSSLTPLGRDLAGAHCLVTHGSVAAVEAVVLGCPVFVAPGTAAAPVGETDLALIETPATPDRTAWLNALADHQYTLGEVVAGRLWEHLGWR